MNEIREQQHIRIQSQHPLPVGKLDGLILRRRESDVFLVVINAAAIFELFQDIDGAVSGGVVDDDDFFVRVTLLQHRFEAAFDKAAAVVSDYGDGYDVVVRHEKEPENQSEWNAT